MLPLRCGAESNPSNRTNEQAPVPHQLARRTMHGKYCSSTQPVRLSFARAKKLPRAAECLVCSLTPSGVLGGKPPKNRGFVGILRGQKCLRRRFLRRSFVG